MYFWIGAKFKFHKFRDVRLADCINDGLKDFLLLNPRVYFVVIVVVFLRARQSDQASEGKLSQCCDETVQQSMKFDNPNHVSFPVMLHAVLLGKLLIEILTMKGAKYSSQTTMETYIFLTKIKGYNVENFCVSV